MTSRDDPHPEDRVDLMEAALALGIHPQSARRLVRDGTILARLDNGKYTVDRTWFDQFRQNYDRTPGRKPKPTLL